MITYVNENKAYANDFGVFEIARVINGLGEDGLCDEQKHLGIALYSRTKSEKDLYLGLRDIMASISKELKHRYFEFRIAEAKHNWQHPRNTAEISTAHTSALSRSYIRPYSRRSIRKPSSLLVN